MTRERRRTHEGFLGGMIGDVRFALRTLSRRPLFTAIAVLTLGLGIGASTAMYSVVDGVLLRDPLNRRGGRLVSVFIARPDTRSLGDFAEFWDRRALSLTLFGQWREETTRFDAVAAHGVAQMTLSGLGLPRVELVGIASSSLLDVLGIQPFLGRGFLPEEEGLEPGAGTRVAMLDYGEWQSSYGSDSEVLGKTVTINDQTFSIVGILPPGFRLRWLGQPTSDLTDDGRKGFWIPLGSGPGTMEGRSVEGIGRLSDGTTLEDAGAEASRILRDGFKASDSYVRVRPRREADNRGLVTPLAILLAASFLLLLIGCGNVATLFMGEVHGRQRELVTRAALGAGRPRLVRQLMTESLILGSIGAAVGVAFAAMATRALVSLSPPLPRMDLVGINGSVLLFTASVGVLASLLFGTIPAAVFARGPLRPAVATVTRRIGSFHRATLVAQVTLTGVLLVTAGLLSRSYLSLLAVDPGFEARNLGAVSMTMNLNRFERDEARDPFLDRILEETRALPDVISAGLTSSLPFPGTSHQGFSMLWDDTREGDPETGRVERVWATSFSATPGFLETLGIPLLSGRLFHDSDGKDAERVILINEGFARRYWPDSSPVGARVRGPDNYFTVVGVVGNAKRETLMEEAEPTFYVPMAQRTWLRTVSVVFRTRSDPSVLLPRIREAIWTADAEVPITLERTMEGLVAESAADSRYRTILVGFFGVLAALMAAVGVFGVTARLIAFQTKEMGVRLALGATSTDLTASTVFGTFKLVLLGLLLGCLISLWAGRALSALLFGVQASDPLTYSAVLALVGSLALASSFVPARRISRLAPHEVLRAE